MSASLCPQPLLGRVSDAGRARLGNTARARWGCCPPPCWESCVPRAGMRLAARHIYDVRQVDVARLDGVYHRWVCDPRRRRHGGNVSSVPLAVVVAAIGINVDDPVCKNRTGCGAHVNVAYFPCHRVFTGVRANFSMHRASPDVVAHPGSPWAVSGSPVPTNLPLCPVTRTSLLTENISKNYTLLGALSIAPFRFGHRIDCPGCIIVSRWRMCMLMPVQLL